MSSNDKTAVMKILRSTPEFTADEVIVAEELIDLYLRNGAASGYYIMVSETDGITAGYICYGPTPLTEGTWDIYWIAVAADRQRHGTGRSLMNSAENGIKEADGRMILIETSSKPEYEKTRNFYKAAGYEVIARIPDFYTPGDDKLVLRKLVI